jgi:hypothetical protein
VEFIYILKRKKKMSKKTNKEEEKAKEEYADNPTIEFHMINGKLVVKGNPFNEEEENKEKDE